MRSTLVLIFFLIASMPRSVADPARAGALLPGQRSDGSVLLPNQWSLRPAGKQILVGDFPSSMALHPSSRYVAILHCGYNQHEVVVVNLVTDGIVSRTPV